MELIVQLDELEGGVAFGNGTLGDRVGKHREDAAHAFVGRVNRKRDAAEEVAVAAQIIHAGDMIGVTVRKNEEIDPVDFFAQALEAELGRGVHLDVQAVHDDVDRSAVA